MRSHNDNQAQSKSSVNDSRQMTWEMAIEDAESEIEQAKQRIRRLEGVVRVCRRMAESGEPFPSDDAV